MNSIAVGGHVINLDAIAWANLDFQWRKDVPQYEQDRNGFAVTVAVKHETHTGVLVRFVDGSTLTFPDGGAAAHVRAALLQDTIEQPAAHPYNPLEDTIIAGLPADMQDAILKT
jgi:hypothetical protein